MVHQAEAKFMLGPRGKYATLFSGLRGNLFPWISYPNYGGEMWFSAGMYANNSIVVLYVKKNLMRCNKWPLNINELTNDASRTT